MEAIGRTPTISDLRIWIRDLLETVYSLRKHPAFVSLYAILSLISLIALLISLISFDDFRKASVQFLWSFYILLQLWLLCRGKTLTWKGYLAFFLAGVWVCAPLTALVVRAIDSLFDVQAIAVLSKDVLAPVAEETFKLLPLGVYLLFSRRATTLSLSDYALIGGASGAGFQYMEETSRRLALHTYGVGLSGKIDWNLYSLFPGAFSDYPFNTVMYAGHEVITALIALSIGFAARGYGRLRIFVYLFPCLLLALGILDHMTFNGMSELPGWVLTLNRTIGGGYEIKPLFLILLVVAVAWDYWALNSVREQLPRLSGEPWITPFSELWHLVGSFVRDRRRFGCLLSFLRERRELGYTLLYGNSESKELMPALRENVRKHHRSLLVVAVILLLAIIPVGWGAASVCTSNVCFACLFDSLQLWWNGLPWYEKGLIILGMFAFAFLFVEFVPAMSIAMTGMSFFESGHQIASIIRHPRRLLSPQVMLPLVGGMFLNRIPIAKAITKILPRHGTGFRSGIRWIGGKFRRYHSPYPSWASSKVPIDIQHIFRGEINNKKAIGFHHRGVLPSTQHARVVPSTETPLDARGVYRAKVQIWDSGSGKWINKGPMSSFFPDSWSQQQVIVEIRGAYRSRIMPGPAPNYWEGKSPSGVWIGGYLNPDGSIRTAFPL